MINQIKNIFLQEFTDFYLKVLFDEIKIYKEKNSIDIISVNSSSIIFVNYSLKEDLLLYPFIFKQLKQQFEYYIFHETLQNKDKPILFAPNNIGQRIFETYFQTLQPKVIENTLYKDLSFLKDKQKNVYIFLFYNTNGENSDTIQFLANLKDILPNLCCNYATITYNNISHLKPIIHLQLSCSNETITQLLEYKDVFKHIINIYQSKIVITTAHLFSYALFSNDIKEGLSRKFLFYKINRLANSIYRNKIYTIARECLEQSYDELFANMLQIAIDDGYLTYNPIKKYKATDKLLDLVSRNSNFTYSLYYNQLRLNINLLNQIWKDIEVYD